ncbi:MAG: polyprenyl synthetase family protein [Bacteroidales bacterium]|nr:polyprenyl synthetase family protein [Bacteroidales bacterium]
MHSLQSLQKIIKEGIADLTFDKQPVELYSPINYILDLGGKRLRPVLCLLACDMFGGNISNALDPAIGIEIFHNFTLLHDDIMDQAPIRRGKSTVHEKWNPNVAILSGDTMMALSYEFIMKTPEKVRSKIFSAFNQTAIEVCEGQQYDMNFESQNDVSIANYIKMIRLKTAVLIAGSLKIGALVAEASPEDADNIYRFGENIGIAFQLKDDLLDVFSDEEKFGKQNGGDILANKKTFLYLKAFELADSKTYESLHFFFNKDFDNELEKINGVKEIYETLNIDSITSKEIEKYFNRGIKFLDKINDADDRKSELIKFADQLKKREF